MKTIRTAGAAFALALVPNVAQAGPAEDIRTVAALDTAYQTAVERNDAGAMAAIMHEDMILVLGDGSVAHVYLENRADKARALEALSRHDFIDVIDPEAPPPYARIGRTSRVGDLMVSVHAGYFTFDTGFWPWFLRFGSFIGNGVAPSKRFGGMHGYNPELEPDVRAIFYAWGHEIAPGVELAGMRTVDVHPTVMRLLGIEPGVPVDGQTRTELLARAAPAQPQAEAVAAQPQPTAPSQ